jgi:hypothetical protein
MTDIYFLSSGRIGYVLPRYDNKQYKHMIHGATFGHSDLHGQMHLLEEANRSVQQGKTVFTVHPVRRFTVMTLVYSEIL